MFLFIFNNQTYEKLNNFEKLKLFLDNSNEDNIILRIQVIIDNLNNYFF